MHGIEDIASSLDPKNVFQQELLATFLEVQVVVEVVEVVEVVKAAQHQHQWQQLEETTQWVNSWVRNPATLMETDTMLTDSLWIWTTTSR